MNKQLIVLLSLLSLSLQAEYAVLVSGSKGFSNYRHQADVCHAYHTLINKGIPASNIIVFSYNDAAVSYRNPFPKQLFNKPDYNGKGFDVNEGCVIDYEGKDVTPANYLNVLKGDHSQLKGKGTERVLESTEDDHVFLYFADHGATGLIAFPHEYLYAKDLIPAFKQMHTDKMYKQLVFYLEACESGSMFLNLPTDINIYALSAASPDESSWATYCYPGDYINGKHVGSCLGDTFSVKFLEDTDQEKNETLTEQFKKVRDQTTKSRVMQWGDLKFTDEEVDEFMGEQDTNFISNNDVNGFSSVDSRDSHFQYLEVQHKIHDTDETFRELEEERHIQIKYYQIFSTLKRMTKQYDTSSTNGISDYNCIADILPEFEGQCGELPRSQMKYIRQLAEMCNYPVYKSVPELINMRIGQACKSQRTLQL